MMRLFNGCGRHRANLRLLVAGALTDQERAAVEHHLVGCSACQKYYDEVKQVAAPFADWEEKYSHLSPSPTVQARWARSFQSAIAPVGPRPSGLIYCILDWGYDMIWPCRRIWTGFAAVWLLLLALNFSTRVNPQSLAGKSSRPSPAMVRAYLEGEGLLSTWSKLGESWVAEPPRPPLPPLRSEWRSELPGRVQCETLSS